MQPARRTSVELIYEGVNISEDIAPYLEGFTYTDNMHGKADEISVTLNNRSGRWSGDWLPQKSDRIRAAIIVSNWRQAGDAQRLFCGEFSVDDSVSAFIRCEGGKTIALEVAWAANRSPNEEYIVRGTESGATFDRGDDTLPLHETGRQGTDHFSDSDIQTRHEDPHKAEQRVFFEAVRDGVTPTRNTVEQALEVQRVIDAIYRSHEEQRAVRLE